MNIIYQKVSAFIELTKPRVLTLVLLSGLTTIFLEKSLIKDPLQIVLLILGLILIGSTSNTLNQIFEIDIDSQMERTKHKRPLVRGDLKVYEAIIFALLMGFSGLFLFYYFYNTYSFMIALFTILFYSVGYTLYLKPYTIQNIVIGGIAGSMAPLIIWGAIRNSIFNLEPWVLFLLIFFWTPPHFWALSLFYKKDYEYAKIPMLPIVKGEKETIKQIIIYSIILFFVSFLFLYKVIYILYTLSAIILGFRFLWQAFKLEEDNLQMQYKFFINSIIYLYILCFTLILDVVFNLYFYL